MDLDPVRARCFLEVVERGTVAAAAGALGYTPSAVSQQVAKLERSLGLFLFDRVSGRLRPTAAGLALVPHVHRALDALESGRRSALEAAATGRPAVSLAAFPSALVNVVAPALAGLPQPAGLVTEAEDDAGLRELSLGHVDVAIVQEHSHQRYRRDPRFRYHRLAADPFYLVIPQDWPAPARLADTGDLPWVVSLPGTPCRLSTEEAWAQTAIRPRIAAQAAELGSLTALIAGRAGVGLLPGLGIPAGAGGIRIVTGAFPAQRSLYAVTRRTNSDGGVGEVIGALAVAARQAVDRLPAAG
ncbi:MAG TPA: LysR family transcriptional regulator [Kineosporiaceae bacterium]|nr:LysR family transcriptional regulator [Kineosporiaceae bacterium]